MIDERESGKNADEFDEKLALNGASNVCSTSLVDVASAAIVDADGRTSVYKEFVGLNKEDLARFATDPFWMKLRLTLLASFWIVWLAMLGGAVVIVILAPKCPPSPEMEWWQPAVIYHVYPRSFQDTDEDGIGDLKGISNRMEYLKNLSVTAVWINSVYPSENSDFGYDITNYLDISPTYGTMDDFKNLVQQMHKMGLKLIVDFVPNHTSRNHTWFQESRRTNSLEHAKYRDFYIWHPGRNLTNGGRAPPNNWLSVFGGPAWEYDLERGEYYFHQFLKEQPDLNLANPEVVQQLDNVLKFWLEKGVDGFYVDSAAYLVESADVAQDEPQSGDQQFTPDDYRYLDHPLTQLQPETFQLITHWRELLDNHTQNDGRPRSKAYSRLLIAEVYATPNESAQFANYQNRQGAHLVTNMALLQLKDGCHADCIHDLIKGWMDCAQSLDLWSNWQLGNHDHSRIATRIGDPDYVGALNLLLMTLPGVAFAYYGEEIGMHDVDVTWEEAQDPVGIKWGKELFMNYSHDPQRSPMQWSDDPQAGFTRSKRTWLPLAKDYFSTNAQAQMAHGCGVSKLDIYLEAVKVRKEPSMVWGDFYQGLEDSIYFLIRQAPGYPGFLTAINFGPKDSSVNFMASSPLAGLVPEQATVVMSTANFEDAARAKEYTPGVVAKLSNVHLKPAEGVVFSW